MMKFTNAVLAAAVAHPATALKTAAVAPSPVAAMLERQTETPFGTLGSLGKLGTPSWTPSLQTQFFDDDGLCQTPFGSLVEGERIVIIMRHGNSRWNECKKRYGSEVCQLLFSTNQRPDLEDAALTEQGIKDATDFYKWVTTSGDADAQAFLAAMAAGRIATVASNLARAINTAILGLQDLIRMLYIISYLQETTGGTDANTSRPAGEEPSTHLPDLNADGPNRNPVFHKLMENEELYNNNLGSIKFNMEYDKGNNARRDRTNKKKTTQRIEAFLDTIYTFDQPIIFAAGHSHFFKDMNKYLYGKKDAAAMRKLKNGGTRLLKVKLNPEWDANAEGKYFFFGDNKKKKYEGAEFAGQEVAASKPFGPVDLEEPVPSLMTTMISTIRGTPAAVADAASSGIDQMRNMISRRRSSPPRYRRPSPAPLQVAQPLTPPRMHSDSLAAPIPVNPESPYEWESNSPIRTEIASDQDCTSEGELDIPQSVFPSVAHAAAIDEDGNGKEDSQQQVESITRLARVLAHTRKDHAAGRSTGAHARHAASVAAPAA